MTSKKQLLFYAYKISRSIFKSGKDNIKLEYKNKCVSIWFHNNCDCEYIDFSVLETAKENGIKFKKAIKKIKE